MEQKKEKPIEYSYSRLDTLCQCGYKYKLKYIEKHYIFCNSVATEFGTLVHETEEAIGKLIMAGEQINYVQIKNKFIIKMNEIKAKYPADWWEFDKSARTYQQKVYEYLEHGIYNLEKFMRERPTYIIKGLEQSFRYMNHGQIHKGFIDRVFYDTATDEYLIQDIKTWAVKEDEDKLASPLQFYFYVKAAVELWNANPDKIRCEYYLPLIVDEETNEFGSKQIPHKGFEKRCDKKILDLFVDIEEGWFIPNPSPLCHWCEFCPTNKNTTEEGRSLCKYFSHWTKENKTKMVNEEFFSSPEEKEKAKAEHKERHAALLEQYKIMHDKTV